MAHPERRGHLVSNDLPTRSPARRNTRTPAKLTAARIIRLWRALDDRRARLKAEALSDARERRRTLPRVMTARQASRPPPRAWARQRGLTAAQRQLLDLDRDLARIAASVRGWKNLARLERQSLLLGPARARAVHDLAAEVAAAAKLANEAWYLGALGTNVERQVRRVLAPWAAITRARNALVARKKRRARNAARDLTTLDAAVVAFIDGARIEKQLVSVHARYVKGHLRHGQQLAVQFLLEDFRATVQDVPAVLRGNPTRPLPARFVDEIRTAAKGHGEHSPAFRRGRDRAILTAHATEVAEVAAVLGRDIITVQEALLCDDVQTVLATDVGLAAQHVLAVLRIIEPRTMQRLLASSRANATTP